MVTKVAFVQTNSGISDSRLTKETTSLVKHGYQVFVIGWDRECTSTVFEIKNCVVFKRLPLHSAYGKFRVALMLPVFWLWATINLLILRPQIVHSCGFDSAIPPFAYRLVRPSARIVFDLYDRYSMVYLPFYLSFLSGIVCFIEEFLAYKADLFITVAKDMMDSLNWFKPLNGIILLNCANEIEIPHEEKRDSKEKEILILAYAGPIKLDRGLIQLLKVVDEIENVELIIMGPSLEENLHSLISKKQRVRYLGVLPYEKALRAMASGDVIVALYSPMVKNYQITYPNKLFEAMMIGKPIITNIAKDIVLETKCGLLVDYYNQKELMDAVFLLKENEETRKSLGLNGRRYFKLKYNWDNMESQLTRAYDALF